VVPAESSRKDFGAERNWIRKSVEEGVGEGQLLALRLCSGRLKGPALKTPARALPTGGGAFSLSVSQKFKMEIQDDLSRRSFLKGALAGIAISFAKVPAGLETDLNSQRINPVSGSQDDDLTRMRICEVADLVRKNKSFSRN